MSKLNLKGLGVALITPFKEDGAVDYEALDRLVDFQLDSGTDYIVVLGTTAETPTLTSKEKRDVVEAVVKRVDSRVPVVMGLGGNNTKALVDELRSGTFEGISAILSVTPYYSKPTQEGLFRHYKALSEASPLPIVLYNVPGRTGVNMTADTTLRIARECENVVAIKEASGNLDQISEIIVHAPEGFQVVSGDDSVTSTVVEMGGVGVISVFANAFPKEMAWLVDRSLNGEAKLARDKMDNEYGNMFNLMFVEGNPAGVKSLLSQKGMIGNVLRLPLTPVSEATAKLIAEELSKFE